MTIAAPEHAGVGTVHAFPGNEPDRPLHQGRQPIAPSAIRATRAARRCTSRATGASSSTAPAAPPARALTGTSTWTPRPAFAALATDLKPLGRPSGSNEGETEIPRGLGQSIELALAEASFVVRLPDIDVGASVTE